MKKTFLALSLTLLLSACGGSSDDNASNTGSGGSTPSASVKKGVLTDGPVSGVRYVSRNAKNEITHQGTTSASVLEGEKGLFEYQEGDTVTFYIGDVQLGESIKAQSKITPLDLATDPVIRTNLLIFLQSLDADKNHSNGIEISTAVEAALKDKVINFKLPTTSFTVDPSFTQVLQAAGTTLVSAQTAKNNFFDSFIKDNAGVWLYENKQANTKVLLYIDAKTVSAGDEKAFNFILGQAAPQDADGSSGIEQGQLKWDATTGAISKTTDFSIDTNGEWGFSHPAGTQYISYGTLSNQLIVRDDEGSYTFTKVENTSGSILGAWISGGQLAAFFKDGTYLHIETIPDDCGSNGIESATYSAANGILKPVTLSYDTNGCAGLIDSAYIDPVFDKFTYVINGDTVTTQYEDEEPRIFSRP
ncbi:hypothetical protein [Acinetobacter bouvetii]|uniref:Uncharacterized protein n=1 Tax=Acinetobacter bouvetii TaxID=202951 RepID=A0A811GD10_9GAMM|nr:hypothetical protein [Acinetobacter bouvetii]CAB1214378.1 hypothetical protein SFB21_1541 [Acinetobacter bouvetii]